MRRETEGKGNTRPKYAGNGQKGMKRKGGPVVFEECIRKRPLLPVGYDDLAEEEVLDEIGFDSEQGDDDVKGVGEFDDFPASNFYRVKDLALDEAYESAQNKIGLQMLSNRYRSWSRSGDREQAFKADLAACLEEKGAA